MKKKRRTPKELNSEVWICSKCGQSKPRNKFRRKKNSSTGFAQPCQVCNHKLNRIWLTSTEKGKDSAAKQKTTAAVKRQNLREETVEAYGGKCKCCGETESKFLGVDHIYNDGATHRDELKTDLYKWLKLNHFPKDRFQLLCHNCNFAKGLYGECPHRKQTKGLEVLKQPLSLSNSTLN
jgi:hypothetical protein